jgi:anti-anti-sigma factor
MFRGRDLQGATREPAFRGKFREVEETTKPPSKPHEPTRHVEPEVDHVLDRGTARITVRGELAEAARRPLVRCLTDLLLAHEPLQRVELNVAGVTFMNSAGMAVLVQLQRMATPRRVEVALVAPPAAVARPLQLSGLWHRFPVLDVPEGLHPEDGGS